MTFQEHLQHKNVEPKCDIFYPRWGHPVAAARPDRAAKHKDKAGYPDGVYFAGPNPTSNLIAAEIKTHWSYEDDEVYRKIIDRTVSDGTQQGEFTWTSKLPKTATMVKQVSCSQKYRELWFVKLK